MARAEAARAEVRRAADWAGYRQGRGNGQTGEEAVAAARQCRADMKFIPLCGGGGGVAREMKDAAGGLEHNLAMEDFGNVAAAH